MAARWEALLFQVCLLIADVLLYVYDKNENVSYACHAGGFIFGVFAGVVVLKNKKVTNCEMLAIFVSCFCILAMFTSWIGYYFSSTVIVTAIAAEANMNCCINLLRGGLPGSIATNTTVDDFYCLNEGGLQDVLLGGSYLFDGDSWVAD